MRDEGRARVQHRVHNILPKAHKLTPWVNGTDPATYDSGNGCSWMADAFDV